MQLMRHAFLSVLFYIFLVLDMMIRLTYMPSIYLSRNKNPLLFFFKIKNVHGNCLIYYAHIYVTNEPYSDV